MALQFTRATKEQAKLRLAIFGPAGSGKTYSALRLATGLGGPIAVIDTERGSASKYADRFAFDVLNLPKKDIETYTQAIQAASQAGYAVLVIDSLSHAWQELLTEVERLASAKYRGNTWSAWSEGTPKQRRLVDAILDYPGHVLATMRTKTEWTTSTNERGKSEPRRVGLAPEQGKGIEYEFDLLMELSTEHVANVIKDRTGRFQDQTIDKPGEDLGRELAAWLAEGNVPAPRPEPEPEPEPKPAPAHLRVAGKTKGENGESKRPYPAQLVRAFIRKRSGVWVKGAAPDYSDAQRNTQAVQPPSEGQLHGLANIMTQAVQVDGDDITSLDNKRHAVMLYCCGVPSSKQLSGQEASAFLDLWKAADSWEVGDYTQAEALAVVAAYQESQGQQRLALDDEAVGF